MKLQSMTDFVSYQSKINYKALSESAFFDRILNYALFLKQPLNLGMFVPCDDEGNVLKEPNCEYFDSSINCKCNSDKEHKCVFKNRQYEQAKAKVLFEGFSLKEGSNKITVNNNTCWNVELFSDNCTDFITIEDLVSRNLLLTKNALKQIGL